MRALFPWQFAIPCGLPCAIAGSKYVLQERFSASEWINQIRLWGNCYEFYWRHDGFCMEAGTAELRF